MDAATKDEVEMHGTEQVQIPIGSAVDCVDGICGNSTHVLVNPITQKVTHLVVKEITVRRLEYMVPIELVAAASPDVIVLTCTLDELHHMRRFVQTQYVEVPMPYATYSGGYPMGSYFVWPYVLSDVTMRVPMEQEQIPPDELVVTRGTQVEATDGIVGHVDELVVNPGTGHITHLVMREGHLFDQKAVTIPISLIDYASDNSVHLTIDKSAVGSLRVIPIRRPPFDEPLVHEMEQRKAEVQAAMGEIKARVAQTKADLKDVLPGAPEDKKVKKAGDQETSDATTQLQIIVAAFSDEDAADLALDELQMASADQGFTLQDAAVVRRDAHGVLHTNETNTWDKGAGAASGSLIGGLLGWLGGPLGFAAGTVGGAVTGDAIAKVHNTRTPAMTADVLKPMEGALQPSSSALIAITGNQPADKVRDLLMKAGASNVQLTALTAEIADALAHHKNVVYAVAGALRPGELDVVQVRLAENEAGAE